MKKIDDDACPIRYEYQRSGQLELQKKFVAKSKFDEDEMWTYLLTYPRQ